MPESQDAANAQNVQLRIDLTPERLQMLESLCKEAGLDSLKDLMSNALTLLHWAVVQRQQGRHIASVDESTQSWRELEMPFFSRVKGAGEQP